MTAGKRISRQTATPARPFRAWTADDYQELTGSNLLPQHHEQLISSGISLDVAVERRYWSATKRYELRELGFGPTQQKVIREAARSNSPAAGLVVPLWWTDPSEPVLHQVRPDSPRRDPNGKLIKYETPRGAGVKLDVHPSMRRALREPEVPFVITEGVKKVDAAVTAGLCCVGMLGVSSWRGQNSSGGVTALGEWNDVHLKGRPAYLCFDSDVMTKPSVYFALLKFRTWLQSKGAEVPVIYLPSGSLGAKVGLDDYLAEPHTRDDLLALATDKVRQPEGVQPGDTVWHLGEYVMEPTGIYSMSPDGQRKRLTNFAAMIERKVVLDDGAEQRQRYDLVVQRDNRVARHSVDMERFPGMKWPREIVGLDLVVGAGPSVADRAREAIDRLGERERPPDWVTAYGHTGWRRLEDDRYVYLHGLGAIGADGLISEVTVELPDELSRFTLPAISDETELCRAVRASLALAELSAGEYMIPWLGVAYRAPLGPCDFSVHVTGASGVLKTSVSKLVQAHFGPGFAEGQFAPGSWMSTGNSLESLAHAAKDATLLVDDYMPSSLPRSEREKMISAQVRLLRAQGNQAGRGRLRADLTHRPARSPRGLILSTGEEPPAGLSQVARVLVIEIPRDAIDLSRLTVAQESADLYSLAMSGYLRWLSGRMPDMPNTLRRGVAQLRPVYAADHRRTTDIAANLELGWSHYLEFADSVDAITVAERQSWAGRVRAALASMANAQAAHQRETDPTERFRDLLASAIASGNAHVAGKDGQAPAEPEAWGWRKHEIGQGVRWEGYGDRIGWVDGDDLYLDPAASYRAAERMASEGQGIGATQTTLAKRLSERGLLTTEGAGKLTVKRSLQGGRPRVWYLRRSYVSQSRGNRGDRGDQAGVELTSGALRPDLRPDLPLPAEEIGAGNRGTTPSGEYETGSLAPNAPIAPVSGVAEGYREEGERPVRL